MRPLHQKGRTHLWVQVQGMSRHGGGLVTPLLVASVFLIKWEAGSSTENAEGETGLEIRRRRKGVRLFSMRMGGSMDKAPDMKYVCRRLQGPS